MKKLLIALALTLSLTACFADIKTVDERKKIDIDTMFAEPKFYNIDDVDSLASYRGSSKASKFTRFNNSKKKFVYMDRNFYYFDIELISKQCFMHRVYGYPQVIKVNCTPGVLEAINPTRFSKLTPEEIKQLK